MLQAVYRSAADTVVLVAVKHEAHELQCRATLVAAVVFRCFAAAAFGGLVIQMCDRRVVLSWPSSSSPRPTAKRWTPFRDVGPTPAQQMKKKVPTMHPTLSTRRWWRRCCFFFFFPKGDTRHPSPPSCFKRVNPPPPSHPSRFRANAGVQGGPRTWGDEGLAVHRAHAAHLRHRLPWGE